MRMKPTLTASVAAALLAGAMLVSPAFAQRGGGDTDHGGPGNQAATMGSGRTGTTTNGNTSGNYPSYGAFRGPGNIPHDAARNTRTAAPNAATGSSSAYNGRTRSGSNYGGNYGGRDHDHDRYAHGGGFGFGFYRGDWGEPYGSYDYDDGDYGYAGGGYSGGDCYTRRIRIHHHWVLRRYCD